MQTPNVMLWAMNLMNFWAERQIKILAYMQVELLVSYQMDGFRKDGTHLSIHQHQCCSMTAWCLIEILSGKPHYVYMEIWG